MSPVVVDASVVAKLVFPEPHRDQAFALFDDAHGGHVIVAPYLMLVEVTNYDDLRRSGRDRFSASSVAQEGRPANGRLSGLRGLRWGRRLTIDGTRAP